MGRKTQKGASEHSSQMVLARILTRSGVLFTATANGGHRTGRAGASLRSAGVKKGVPDILIFTPPPLGGFVGAAVELKREDGGGRLSTDQQRWIFALIQCGWFAVVAEGHNRAIELLRSVGYVI